MKKYLFLIWILFSLDLYAQGFIVNRYGPQEYGKITNAYYKDVDGFNNQYFGTWIYSNGATTLKIILAPRNNFHVTTDVRNYYADFLIGEFQYVENGIEKANTLLNINQAHVNIFDYNIVSLARSYKTAYPLCSECGEDERRLVMLFNEPSRRNIWNGISNRFVIRRFFENGQEKLKLQFVYTGNGLEILDNMDGQPANLSNFNLPYGEYVLIKQP